MGNANYCASTVKSCRLTGLQSNLRRNGLCAVRGSGFRSCNTNHRWRFLSHIWRLLSQQTSPDIPYSILSIERTMLSTRWHTYGIRVGQNRIYTLHEYKVISLPKNTVCILRIYFVLANPRLVPCTNPAKPGTLFLFPFSLILFCTLNACVIMFQAELVTFVLFAQCLCGSTSKRTYFCTLIVCMSLFQAELVTFVLLCSVPVWSEPKTYLFLHPRCVCAVFWCGKESRLAVWV